MKQKAAIWLAILLLTLTSCGADQPAANLSESTQEQEAISTGDTSASRSDQPASEESADEAIEDAPAFDGPATQEYIQRIVQDSVSRFEEPGMSEYEKVKAAFDYMIEIGYYRRPSHCAGCVALAQRRGYDALLCGGPRIVYPGVWLRHLRGLRLGVDPAAGGNGH